MPGFSCLAFANSPCYVHGCPMGRLMTKTIRLGLISFLFVLTLAAKTQTPTSAPDPRWKTMPYPAQVEVTGGAFRVTQDIRVELAGFTEPRLEHAVARFMQTLSRETGMPLVPDKASAARIVVHTEHASKKVQEVDEDESYTLTITTDRIELNAPTPLGAMHGLATILQAVEPGTDGFVIPTAVIHDRPRFAWRGLLVDSCRHWMPKEIILRTLDGMAMVKMNVLHWHLSENQGFRIESKKYPKLQELGSDNLYYTQDEVRDFIAYARERGIRVVPEFDMPGHSTAWFVGHPELASGP